MAHGDSGAFIVLLFIWIPSIPSAILSLITIWHNQSCSMRIDWVLMAVFCLALPNSWIALLNEGGDGCCRLFFVVGVVAMITGYFYSFVGMIVNSSKTPGCSPMWVRVVHWILLVVGFVFIILPTICLIPDFCHRIEKYREKQRNEEAIEKLIEEMLTPPDQSNPLTKDFQKLLDSNSSLRYRIESYGLWDKHVQLITNHHCQIKQEQSLDIMDESRLDCSVCSRPVETGESFLQLPDCRHIYEVKCIPRSNRCRICNCNIILSLAADIHKPPLRLS